jgi:hypothetical protein
MRLVLDFPAVFKAAKVVLGYFNLFQGCLFLFVAHL